MVNTPLLAALSLRAPSQEGNLASSVRGEILHLRRLLTPTTLSRLSALSALRAKRAKTVYG